METAKVGAPLPQPRPAPFLAQPLAELAHVAPFASKKLISFEDAHASWVGTFVGIEHLRQRGWPRALYKEAMRKQYHFRKSQKGFYAWDVDRLLDLSRDIEIIDVPLTEIAELDEDYWFAGSAESPTCRKVVEHCDLINKADLSYPIVLCSEGRVMDGMHRIAKALLVERRTIKAVKFSATPEPDYVDVLPHELTYLFSDPKPRGYSAKIGGGGVR